MPSTRSLSAAAMLATAFVLAACSVEAGETPVTEVEKTTVLEFAEPKVDAQMAALAASDYQGFLVDYDEAMKQATSFGEFEQLQIWLNVKVGAYLSREVSSVAQTDTYYTVMYKAKFTKDGNVTMRVVFEKTGAHRISGLWFDSPNMRD
jgi:hypothetical protein